MPSEIRSERPSHPSFTNRSSAPSKWTWIQVGSGVAFVASATAFGIIFFTPHLTGLFLIAPGVTGVASVAVMGAVAVRKRKEDYVFVEVVEQRGTLRRSPSYTFSSSSSSESDEESSVDTSEGPHTEEKSKAEPLSKDEGSLVNEIPNPLPTVVENETPESPYPEVNIEEEPLSEDEVSLIYEIPSDVEIDDEDADDCELNEDAEYKKAFSVTLLSVAEENFERQTTLERLYLEPLLLQLEKPIVVPPPPPPLPKPPAAFKIVPRKIDKLEEEMPSRASTPPADDNGLNHYMARLEEINVRISLMKDGKELQSLVAERDRLGTEIDSLLIDNENKETIELASTSEIPLTTENDPEDIEELKKLQTSYFEQLEKIDEQLKLEITEQERNSLEQERSDLEAKLEENIMELIRRTPASTEEFSIKPLWTDSASSKMEEEGEKYESTTSIFKKQNARHRLRIQMIDEQLETEKVDDNRRALSMERQSLLEFIEETNVLIDELEKPNEVQNPKKKRRSKKAKPEVTGAKLVEKHFVPGFKAVETLLHDFLIAHYRANNPKKPKESAEKYALRAIKETNNRGQKISTALEAIYGLILTHVRNCEKISSLSAEEMQFVSDIDANFNKKSFLDLLTTVENTYKEETKNKEKKFSNALRKFLKTWKVSNSKQNPLSIILNSIVSEENLFGTRIIFASRDEIKTKTPEELKILHRQVMQELFKAFFVRLKNDPFLKGTQNPALMLDPLFPELDYKLFELFAPFYLKMVEDILNPKKEEALRNILKTNLVEERMDRALRSQNAREHVIALTKDLTFEELYHFYLTDRIDSFMCEMAPRLHEMEMELMISLDPKKPIVIRPYRKDDEYLQTQQERNADFNKQLKAKFPLEIKTFNELLAKINMQLVAVEYGSFSPIYWIKNLIGDLQGGNLAKVLGGGLSVASAVVSGETVLNMVNKYLTLREEEPILIEVPGFSSEENAFLKKNVCIILENLLVPLYDVLLASKGSPMHEMIRNFFKPEAVIGKFVLETYPKLGQSKDTSFESVLKAILDLQTEISQIVNPTKISLKKII